MVELPQCFPLSFPQAIFRENVGPHGEIIPAPAVNLPSGGDASLFSTPEFGQILASTTPQPITHFEIPLPSSAPVMTHLQVTREFAAYLRALEADFAAIDKKKLNHYEAGGLGSDDWKEMHNALLALIDNYDSH